MGIASVWIFRHPTPGTDYSATVADYLYVFCLSLSSKPLSVEVVAAVIFSDTSDPSHHWLELPPMTTEIFCLQKVRVYHFVNQGFSNLSSIHIFVSKNAKAEVDFGGRIRTRVSVANRMASTSSRCQATIPNYRNGADFSVEMNLVYKVEHFI
jgi:hypothetical protein